jgi:hypothetical protein
MNSPLAFFFNEIMTDNATIQQSKLVIVQDSAASHGIVDSIFSAPLPQLDDGSSRWESSPTRETTKCLHSGPKMPLRRPVRRDSVESVEQQVEVEAEEMEMPSTQTLSTKKNQQYANDMAFYLNTMKGKTQSLPKSLRSLAA